MPYPINQRAHQFNSIQSVPVSFGLWDTALKFLSPGPRSDVTDHLVNCVSANLSLKSFPETVKTGNKKRATCLATLLQNKLNSDVARITTHIKLVSTNQIVNRFERWWQNVRHHYSTCSAAVLQDNYHVFCCPFLRTFSGFKLLTVDLLDN